MVRNHVAIDLGARALSKSLKNNGEERVCECCVENSHAMNCQRIRRRQKIGRWFEIGGGDLPNDSPVYRLECSVMSGPKIAATVLLISAATACAQEIPPATALPVTLNSTLDVRKVVAGQPITASIAQDVPLPSGGWIRAGWRVSGHVLQAGTKAGKTYVRLRFDQISADGREIAITTSLRALASPEEVREAQLPTQGALVAESPAHWTTTQIGGTDVVYRGGGHVVHDTTIVGDPVKDGVLAVLRTAPRPGCETASGDRRLALWVFSSSACGVYGFRHLGITHAGNASPMGEIVLESKKNLHMGTGSAMLLLTVSKAQ
jgi:hypothetical protein